MDYPSKWLDFPNQKEIRRLRRDINNTTLLKLQILASVIVAIITLFLTNVVKDTPIHLQIILCVSLCLLAALIFVAPAIFKRIKSSRMGNVLIKGKDAVGIFDDEITYNVLTACEYCKFLTGESENELDNHLQAFYRLEIAYYLSSSIEMLSTFSASINSIIGASSLCNKISKERMINIICLIESLIKRDEVEISENLREQFYDFKRIVQS